MWQRDLQRNAGEQGVLGFIRAWIACPGFAVVTLIRLAQLVKGRGNIRWWLSRMIWRHVVTTYGCYISLECRFGPGLKLPHPVGVVIGEGVSLGSDVTIYQGVTIGRRIDALAEYPIIGDRVTIYSGATVIGKTLVGDGAVIGAHSVVTSDVAAEQRVAGAPARAVGASGKAQQREV